MDSPEEQWRPIPGWDGFYEASSHGRVRSVDRIVPACGAERSLKGKVLEPGVRTDGRYLVVLCREGVCKSKDLARLVLLTFAGPPRAGQECCHVDDVRTDNRIENLYWGTRSDNLHDMVRNGRHWAANKTHCKHGHEFTPANTALASNGRNRQCRACRTVASRRRRARMKLLHTQNGDNK